jgi:hypothetical protein
MVRQLIEDVGGAFDTAVFATEVRHAFVGDIAFFGAFLIQHPIATRRLCN